MQPVQPATERGRRSRGQVLVIFAMSILLLLGFCAIVVDVTWYWANTLRVQRAADAAALAGVVNLPGNVPGAVTTAVTAAKQNGYTVSNGCKADGKTPSAVPGMCAGQDPSNDRQLDVTLSEPVNTFFMHLFGINSITATRNSKALYVLPVPMGSPLNYYGVGCFRSPSGAQPVCTTAGNSNGASGIPDATVVNPTPPTGGGAPSQLNSQGFFGAAITKGGNTQNGDAYDPALDNYGGRTTNPSYDPAGVYYEVVIPAGDSNGSVHIFDPGFCAVQYPNYGTSDHWIGGQGPVSTYYNLWDTHGNPYATGQFALVTASGTRFENQKGADTSMGGPNTGVACDAYHDRWWTMVSGLAPGLYYLQVTTTKVDTTTNGGQNVLDPTINANTNAENMYSLEVTAAGATTPQVFGAGKMVAYNNLAGGDQLFYLAQIPKVDAGKTLEIDLFDIGDVSSTATLKILDPNGNVYTNATFNYTADSLCNNSKGNCSGNNATTITTTFSDGTHPFNDSWITILIPLPSTYGSGGLTPPGETQPGWWKIDYNLSGGTLGNDTTTWRVGVRGNPVHLIVP
ncbi:MAG: pilus assembly protein TadG-related protein [Candidatus Limnocylindrales bacterium]